MAQNMKVQTYVMTIRAVKLGFQKKIEYQNGVKIGIDNWNKIIKAVNETLGEVVTYEGQIINAFFHSNSGGTTETVSEVWGGTDLPYLKSVETSGEDAYTEYNSEVILSKEELINKLKEKYNEIEIDFENQDSIKILEYTQSGRVKTIKFGNRELSRS